MKTNWHTCLVGSKVVLIPYRKEHVEKYHKWMSDEALLHLTGSEPLTLDQEYEMQVSWRDSDDKCTFIVLEKHKYLANKDEEAAMIGDTNLYLSSEDQCAEAEIMIAEETARGLGYGWEAMCMMLRYGIETLKISKFEAKIKFSNVASIKMFEKLGFREESRSRVFEEVKFIAIVDDAFKRKILEETKSVLTKVYEHEQ
jgi:RimJ/RimL family protein N-acetyltransferase